MRENYNHIREPRYSVQYAKVVTPTDVTVASGTGTTAWAQLSTTYLDQVDIVTSGGRDVLVASNPTGRVNNAATLIHYGFNWDDVPLYSNTQGLGTLTHPAAAFDITIPIFTIIPAPTEGEHTLKFYFTATTSASSAIMNITPKFFLLAMEL
jgi:hypothetical protein